MPTILNAMNDLPTFRKMEGLLQILDKDTIFTD